MNLWSLMLFIQQTVGPVGINNRLPCTIIQQQDNSSHLFVKLEGVEVGENLLLTIFDNHHSPVRMIPIAPNSISAGQLICLTGLSSGKYIARVTVAGRVAEENIEIRQ
ncbi:hypothetical protein [Chitinophaga flava]|uniref:Uncharacterized protein n=1 Tax=Chitinophaga flava TaxID=2259036 RepID=A0A365XW51_9BACT|nr:hypothetical protein [Chitinophaga flava]RBL90586.1 hypothetical protein DF182_29465 [Chitinophaga flava]